MAHVFCCCWVVFVLSRTFWFLGPCQPEGWRDIRNWEGTQLGQLTPTGQRDVPYHRMPHWVYKLGWGGQGLRVIAQGLAGCWAIALCSTCFLFSLPFGFHSSPLLPPFHYNLLLLFFQFYFNYLIVLISTLKFQTPPWLSPHPLGEEGVSKDLVW